MARTLDVYLHNELVGHLVQDDGGQMVFDYNESWLQKPNATPLSQSLPLRSERFTRKECRGFFAGILPEESKREIIARNLGISARNDYAMLEQIGGECAGAVTFVPAGENLPERNYGYRTLSSQELAALLNCQNAHCWRASMGSASRLPAHKTKSLCALRAMRFLCHWEARQARIY